MSEMIRLFEFSHFFLSDFYVLSFDAASADSFHQVTVEE